MSDQNADETIVFKYLVDAQDAIARANEFRSNVNKIKEEIKTLSSQSGRSFKDIAQGMQQAVKVDFQNQINQVKLLGSVAKLSAQQIQAAIAPLQQARQTRLTEINTALKETEAQSKNLGSSFGVLGTAIGTALGFTAYQLVSRFFGLIRDGVQWLQQSAQVGYEFAKSIFQIQIGVNALRRAGVDITFGQVYEQLIKLKTQFGIFSTTELVQGAAAFLNLNRDMGFTREELFKLQESVATLAVVNGRSMEEVQRTVALALSSGYTEGLQRLGVSINRVTIAQEAARLGYADSYMALTEVQRAQATYNLILQKTAVYSKDLLEYQKTLPGQIDTTKAAIVDASAKTGASLLGAELAWERFKLKVVNVIGVITTYIGGFTTALQKAVDEEEKLLNRRLTAWEIFVARLRASQDWAASVINTFMYGKPLEEEQQIPESEVVPKIPPALTDEQVDAVDAAIKKIKDLETQFAIDQREAAIDLQRDLTKITEDGMHDRANLYVEYMRKVNDINRQAAYDVADATANYNLDVQQAQAEYQNSIADNAQKHANRLLEIEENYQEKLLKLREGFLLDLEDALQARDARQVLNLIRRYNVERAQAKRERDQNLKEEERNYKEQLDSLNRQRNERLKKLRQEFEARLRAIELQRQRELAEEKRSYEEKLFQQKVEEQRKTDERNLRYQQELEDMKRHNLDQINAIAQGLIDAGITTQTGMDAVYAILEGYIGSDGSMLQLWRSYSAAIAQMLANAFAVALAAPPALPTETRYTNPNQKGFAKGGLEIATKPTMAIYGEGGVPELHAFIPLTGGIGSLSSSGKPAKIPEIQSRGKGKAQVEILLGAGLEGRIVDKALDNVADIIIKRKLQ